MADGKADSRRRSPILSQKNTRYIQPDGQQLGQCEQRRPHAGTEQVIQGQQHIQRRQPLGLDWQDR